METHKISCHCKNSIKMKIMEFIMRNDQCIQIEQAIDKIHTIIKSEIEDTLNLNELFLKGYIRGLITELINDKLISSSEIILNKGQDKQEDYYYMKFVKPIEHLFNEQGSFVKEIKEIEKKEVVIKNDNKENNNIHQTKAKEYMQLKKTLEKTKKESRSQELIKALHKYNELKDIAQELLGRIASQRNMRIKELYEELAISDDDN